MTHELDDAPLVAFKLSQWALQIQLEDIPLEVRKIAARALLDTLSVAVAGVNADVACKSRNIKMASANITATGFDEKNCVTEVTSSHYGQTKNQATIWGVGKSSPENSAYFNAIAGHALDMDDTCFAGIIHGSVVIIPLVIAEAERLNLSGRDVVTAIVVASEICYVLGDIVGDSVYANGWWPTGLFATIGGVVALAKIGNLNMQTTAAAIAIGATNACCFRSMQGTELKPLAIGEVIRCCHQSVNIAKHEFTVPLDVFERDTGFLKMCAPASKITGDNIKQCLSSLGKKWRLKSPGLVIKLFPLCSCAQPAVQAIKHIMVTNKLKASDIVQVEIITTSMVTSTLVFDHPTTPAQAMFSLTFAIACMINNGNVLPEHLTLSMITKDTILSTQENIKYKQDDNRFNLADSPEAAVVTVIDKSGKQYSQLELYAMGDDRYPVTSAVLRSKFVRCLGTVLESEKVEEILERLDSIESLTRIRQLMELFLPMEIAEENE